MQLAALVRAGNFLSAAAQTLGLSNSTAYGWKKKGEDGIEPYTEFSVLLAEAEGAAEQVAVQSIRNAMSNKVGAYDWKAAAYWLEHVHPERWGAKQTIELIRQASGGAATAELTEEEILERLGLTKTG